MKGSSKRSGSKKAKCHCITCMARRKSARKKRRRVKPASRSRMFKVNSSMSTRRTKRRVYIVDARGRVRGSFKTTKSGTMTKGAARKRFNTFGSKSSRTRDKGRRARNVYSLRANKRNRRGQAKWYLRPDQSDIRGIDTKMGRKRSGKKRKGGRRSRSIGRSRSRSV